MISIRTRLFLTITLLIFIFVLLSWGFSAFLLEDLYIWQKKRAVVAQALTIEELYGDGAANISLELERIGTTLGAGIIIFSPDGFIRQSSLERIIRPQRMTPPASTDNNPNSDPRPLPPPLLLKSREEAPGNSVIEFSQDPALSIEFLTLKKVLSNRDILEIRLPLAAMADSAYYAAQAMAVIGILFILAGSVWAFSFAKSFTAPLRELARVAQSISQLDFSQICRIRRRDEIGALGQSINHLSLQLSQAIHSLNRTNRELQADVEQERRLDKLRKNFISSVSHELRTPLSLILGYAEGLKENVAQSQEEKNYYSSVIMDEAEKMSRLVKDLLDLSQIESGYFPLERSDFDAALLLNGIVQKYQTLVQEKNITLQHEPFFSILVNGDELRVEQILFNLLNNAIDHVEAPYIIRLGLQETEAAVRISLFNTGKPIAPDILDDIWLSFYKADKARNRDLGGYGLGLSIVKAIQELHGREYGAFNSDGGVTFWFDIAKNSSTTK